MSSYPMPAVILAGAKAGDALAEHGGVACKALLPIRGRPMVAWVADALSHAATISQTLVVGPPEVADALPGVTHVPDAGSFLGNVVAAVLACPDAARCLVVTSDIPLLTPGAIDRFVEQACERGVEFAYPIVSVDACEARFPGMRRTSLRLREGRFTGGNAVVVSPGFILRNQGLIEGVFTARKQPLRLASMLGWVLVLRILLSSRMPGLVPLALIEDRISRLVGGSVAGIALPYPEIGADIDKPGDLEALDAVQRE